MQKKKSQQRFAQRVGLGAIIVAALTLLLSSLGLATVATAAPSQDDVDRARAEEKYAELSVAQIEVQLATASAAADDAWIEAALAAEELNSAQEKLDLATETAVKADEEAKEAQKKFEEGLTTLASVVQLAYRSGGGSLDSLTPYLESDGLQTIEQRRNIVDSFGNAADTAMQEVAALRQVADVLSEAAQRAKKAEETAFTEVEDAAAAAQTRASEAQAIVDQTELTKAALIAELADKRNTTVELETERIAEAERVREEETKKDALKKEDEVKPATKPSQSPSSTDKTTEKEPDETPSSPKDETPATDPKADTKPDPEPEKKPEPKPDPTPEPKPNPAPDASKVSKVISYARAQIGAKYLWGGSGPKSVGFDCSGLTYKAYKQVGITLNRTAAGQYSNGKRYPLSEAKAGDLVFWARGGSIYHVALYSGPGTVISAHQPGRPLDEGALYNFSTIMPYVVRVL